MPAHERHAERSTRRAELREERAHRRLAGAPLGQETRGEEPPRRGPADGEVVGVDDQSIPAEILGHECDRVGGRDEVAVAHVEDGRILADARADDHARVRGVLVRQEVAQEVRPELAERERRRHASRVSIARPFEARTRPARRRASVWRSGGRSRSKPRGRPPSARVSG